MNQPVTFGQVDTVAHQGSVVAFGEEWNAGPLGAAVRRLWYRVLDLAQTADEDQPGAWEDSTRWTRWYEVSWPHEIRPVGMSLLTIDLRADHGYATIAGRWKTISDGVHIYLFRALDLRGSADGKAIRVYSTRYNLIRLPSPDGGTNKAASGQGVTVPQLQPVREARYRRSEMRETPLGDTDSQGTRDLDDQAFVEPCLEWSMLRPIDGAFAVTLTPSNVPGRMRWQFFCRGQCPAWPEPDAPLDPVVAAFSFLRDDEGSADLTEKFDQLNTPADPGAMLPDAVFALEHPDHGLLRLHGRPDTLTFRLQEQGSGGRGEEDRAVSPQRVMLATRVAWLEKPLDDQGTPVAGDSETSQIERNRPAVLDFALDATGAVMTGPRISLGDIDFARTALWLNSDADRVDLLPAGERPHGRTRFSAHLWVRHDEGTGTLLCRGWDAGEDPLAAESGGWAIEWRADRSQVVGVCVLAVTDGQGATSLQRFEAVAPVPVSFTWHHLALVLTDGRLTLHVDGVAAAETILEAEPVDGTIDAALTAGGPVHGGPPGSWLDVRIDQVVVWKRPVVPTSETIHLELGPDALDDPDLLGAWSFDRSASNKVDVDDDAGFATSYTNRGADVVSQTAPLFPADKADFEKHLSGLSAGMGLLAVPGWQIDSDPRLFAGADGIVRLYAIARSEGAQEETAGALVYDTTTTRAQFTFDWKAEGESSVRQGQLVLQARLAGPVMNRAVLALEGDGDDLTLKISHPYRNDLEEIWTALPRRLQDLTAVLNGRASADPDDDAVKAGDLPLYAYGTHGPQRGRDNAYASELVQAMPLSVPDNGAEALVQPAIAAKRQLGNFTGWTRAPLAVSGRFGDAGHGTALASVGLAQDRLERLRLPGDFAIEAWIRPSGGADERRVINWLQGDDDGVALRLANERVLGLSADGVDTATLASTSDVAWFSSDAPPSCTIRTAFRMPFGGREGGLTSLLSLVSEDRQAPALGDLLEEIARQRAQDIAAIADDDAREAAEEELRSWRAGAFDDASTGRFEDLDPLLTIVSRVAFRFSMRGVRFVIDVISGITISAEMADPGRGDPFWIETFTGRRLSASETTDYVESVLIPLWTTMALGGRISPPGASWSVSMSGRFPLLRDWMAGRSLRLIDVPVDRDEGARVSLTIFIDPQSIPEPGAPRVLGSGNRGRVSCYVDGRLASGFSSSEDNPEETWLAPARAPSTARVVLGRLGNEARPPFAGTIDSVEIWPRLLPHDLEAGTTPSSTFSSGSPTLAVDLTEARSDGSAFVVTAAATPARDKDLSFPAEAYRGAFHVRPMLGERRYRTVRSIPTADWLHLGLVCSDNFAVRFAHDGDRAVIKDAGGLNPDRGFTIACVVVRESRDAERAVFSKAVEAGDERIVTYRLSIGADGRPRLRYTIEVEGELRVREVVSDQVMQIGRPYHLFAAVELVEVFSPEKSGGGKDGPVPRWQLWCADEHVWLFDVAAARWLGDAPVDFPAAGLSGIAWVMLTALQRVYPLFPESSLLTLATQVLPAQYGVLRIHSDAHPFYDVRIRATAVAAAIGAATGEEAGKIPAGAAGWFRGLIGSVQIWRSRLPATLLKALAVNRDLPVGVNDPTGWWRFDENKGLQARDSAGGRTAMLTREGMWTTSRATARLSLFVNGRPVPMQSETGGARHTYGRSDHLTLGALADVGGAISEPLDGLIDEVRIWSDVRSNEEILDNMHVRLGGNEDDLAAYWPISAGIGRRIKDATVGGNHALLNLSGEAALRAFWQSEAAPVGDDLPQVRHLLGGLATSWTATGLSAPPMAAEYGDVQTDPEGRMRAVQKRGLIFARDIGADLDRMGEQGWVSITGFKTGDLDLIYVGQAQSDPTLIGYIEGAPPVPSENLTRAYWTSAPRYNAYSGNSVITLEEAEHTSIAFDAAYDRGFDMNVSLALKLGFETETSIGAGVAFGGFADGEAKVATLEANVGVKADFEHSQGWLHAFGTSIGTSRTAGNTLALGGSWERSGSLLNRVVGRRYLPDNVGYALVKSGVANVFALRLRKNNALLGLRMVPDPDIPEDFNILTFRIRNSYTKQGTLDGMVGHVADAVDWPEALQRRGSYFRPLEVANLEAEIEAYEATIAASYEAFDAGAHGRRSKGTHFQDDDPAANPRRVIEDNIEQTYDWARGISRRNIVNTYVWTSSGGLFAEQTRTNVSRSESKGGSFAFKGMGGVVSEGKFKAPVGLQWDGSALFGGHIQTTVTKTKNEGREFGLSVSVGCDDLLERYEGKPEQLYSGQAEPGKVQGYRFKSFYLVPDKRHFEHFFAHVVDTDWLESDDADARALRQARGNLNHVWRVFHRVTYVNRVPPRRDQPLPPPVSTARSVVHQGPNWQIIKLVLDVLREGMTSTGVMIAGLANPYEKLAVAVDDVVRHRLAANAPWWQVVVEAAQDDPDGEQAEVLRQLRRATFEYMRAYLDTGLLAADLRLTQGPQGQLAWGRRVSTNLIALYRFTAGSGEVVADVSGFGSPLDLIISEPDHVSWLEDGGVAVEDQVLIASAGPASKIVEACRASGEITIEAWIRPTKARQKGPARIVSLSKDPSLRNFTLGHGHSSTRVSGHFVARLRTTDPRIDDNGLPSTNSDASRATTGITHLAFTRAVDGEVALYVDGQRVKSGQIAGSFDNWDPDFRFALANELTGDRPWIGELRLVAIYSRALSAAGIAHNFRLDSQTWE